jgi:hypothetical protein
MGQLSNIRSVNIHSLICINHIENVVTFANLWLILETSTDCFENVKTVNISSVSDIVNGDGRMKDDT